MKLGELFIDLGVNSGGAFNALSGFAFKLTNIADLAGRVNTAIEKGFGDQARWANDILNLSQALDVSTKTLQGLRIAAKEVGTPFDRMGEKLKKLDEERLSWLAGENEDFTRKMSWFRLNNTDIQNAQNSLELMQLMIQRTANISDNRLRESFRRAYGFNEDETRAWLNFFRERQRYENNSAVLSEEELQRQREIAYSLNNLGIATETMWNKISIGKAEVFKDFIDWLVKSEEKFADLITRATSFREVLVGLPSVFLENAESVKEWEDRLSTLYDWLQKVGAFVNGAMAFSAILFTQLKSGVGFKQAFKDAKEGYEYARGVSLGDTSTVKNVLPLKTSSVSEDDYSINGMYDEIEPPVNENAAWAMSQMYNDNSTTNIYVENVKDGVDAKNDMQKTKMNMVYDRNVNGRRK